MFIVKEGQKLTPFSRMQNATQLMYTVLGNILIFYNDHDTPLFMKMIHLDTGHVLDIEVRPKMDEVQEFLTENYEHGAHRESVAKKVSEQYCPLCKEDSFYYMSYRRTCTDFGTNRNEELHFGLCTTCNHFKRYEEGRE